MDSCAAVNNGVTTELYVDGVRQLRNVQDDEGDGPPVGSKRPCKMASSIPWLIGKASNSFNGWISEVRVTDHALKLNEMLFEQVIVASQQ